MSRTPLRNLIGGSFGVFSRMLNAVAGGWPCCRFEPSCSHYGREAVQKFGVVRGSWLAFRRVWRCRPGGEWGYDPVPREITSRVGNKL